LKAIRHSERVDLNQTRGKNSSRTIYRVNADFRHLPALFGFLVTHVSVVLNDESVVRDEWSMRIEAVHLHRVHPPIDLAAHAFLAARLWRAAAHAVSFHTDNIVVVQIEGLVPRLFSS
jgi:hypothetical protein